MRWCKGWLHIVDYEGNTSSQLPLPHPTLCYFFLFLFPAARLTNTPTVFALLIINNYVLSSCNQLLVSPGPWGFQGKRWTEVVCHCLFSVQHTPVFLGVLPSTNNCQYVTYLYIYRVTEINLSAFNRDKDALGTNDVIIKALLVLNYYRYVWTVWTLWSRKSCYMQTQLYVTTASS